MQKFWSARPWLLPAVAVLAVVGIAVLWWATRPHTFTGTLVQPPVAAADFSLPATPAGGELRLSALRGKMVLLFFGYTNCPDFCPTTLGNLKLALARLGSQTGRVQVVMVTVDPERDSLERLATYLASFDTRFIGMSGSAQATRQVADLFGIYYAKRTTEAGGYLIDHTASVLVIDAQGNLRMTIPYGTPPAAIAADLQELLK